MESFKEEKQKGYGKRTWERNEALRREYKELRMEHTMPESVKILMERYKLPLQYETVYKLCTIGNGRKIPDVGFLQILDFKKKRGENNNR